ncbi:GerMN domain-containing protein [Calidifontibacillus erzurumensis]|uniref:GerMN domain-containing protein n=1 Tax=Calidifontibacillus erzurumensis TaxID=2741433 RepID=A0A8J8GFN7_9BACI|nr:GerMN domain-containing protein [Calidifontibacillus erzurumensis]NSL51558.1 GerMN domain-containing protein [Calidifontibacillus erzurumensis]
MFKIKKTGIIASFLALTALLTGCALGGEQAVNQTKDNEFPQEVTYVEEETLEQTPASTDEVESKDEAQVEETVQRELYLFDKNGYVVPQMIPLPKTKEVAKQALEYLVEGGPITELLPNGFRAVLPPGTMVNGVNLLEDGTLVVDFSKEFANYKAEDELKILQAITYTLTQFDTVKKVKIQINGHDQTHMPVNGTPINQGTSRAIGINFDNGEVVDVTNSKAVTLYFLAQNGDNTYYVPVTRRIDKNVKNTYEATVKELIKGPDPRSGLYTELHDDIALIDEPTYKNGTVTLNFNEGILNSLEGTALSQNIINEIVLSLTEQDGVESVAIKVNGKEKLLTDKGVEISSPVSRPKSVNTGSF